ncbi:GNAT family N-acetyltransferase [Anoxybacteroides tepidamans]|uniref:GNAT family N-acetyltransferase n=1 Tax=Anoxybacteroides tepidamans TaxID=265948 RepID=UPI00048A22D0|nr:GNAT family N-acetyltransferase [Anoxybacillus tepidamans]
MNISLRTIDTVEELQKMAQLEQNVWKSNPTPLHQTLTAAKNGGIVIGAYVEERMIGFVYSFPGYKNGQVYLCSHMLGIDESFRNRGIGYILKMKQAEEAKKLGYETIRWTYDPLESRNGYLNIVKLGAICSEYIENCYGEMNDALNHRLPSDRFNVEWKIGSDYLEERKQIFSNIHRSEEAEVLHWKIREDGEPEAFFSSDGWQSLLKQRMVFVPVPLHFQRLKEKDHQLALDWRHKTREVFVKLFREGWAVVHAIRNESEPVQYYVLIKRDKLPL